MERAAHVSVASAMPDRNCVTPASASSLICSASTTFSATHRLSVSSYFHGNLHGLCPVKAQEVLFINAASSDTPLIGSSTHKRIFHIIAKLTELRKCVYARAHNILS